MQQRIELKSDTWGKMITVAKWAQRVISTDQRVNVIPVDQVTHAKKRGLENDDQ